MDDDRPSLPRPAYVLGQDLAHLSEEELIERMDELRREIMRLEAALQAKRAAREAASLIFRPTTNS